MKGKLFQLGQKMAIVAESNGLNGRAEAIRTAQRKTERNLLSTRGTTSLLAVCAAVVFSGTLTSPASADRDDPAVPSKGDVEAAQRHVVDTQRSVADIRADLEAADAKLEALSVAAEQASEAYNGAVLQWQQAKSAAVNARERADRALKLAVDARAELTGLVVSQQTVGIDLSAFNTALTANGPHTLMAEMSRYDTSERALSDRYQLRVVSTGLWLLGCWRWAACRWPDAKGPQPSALTRTASWR